MASPLHVTPNPGASSSSGLKKWGEGGQHVEETRRAEFDVHDLDMP